MIAGCSLKFDYEIDRNFVAEILEIKRLRLRGLFIFAGGELYAQR